MSITNSDILRGALAFLLTLAVPSAAGDHPHDLTDCGSCHGAATRGAEARNHACNACHGAVSEAPWGSPGFHEPNAECTNCHVFHDSGLLRLPSAADPISLAALTSNQPSAVASVLTACAPCHARGDDALDFLTPGHRAAAAYYHSSPSEVLNQSVSESCLRCHDADRDLPDSISGEWDPPRPHVNASHPYGIEVAGTRRGGFSIRPTIDSRLELVDGRMECTTCHDIFRDENDMLVQIGSSYADLCTGCHARENGIGDFAVSR